MWNQIIREDIESIIQDRNIRKLFNGKTVLITGATGMIPSYMVFALLYLNEIQVDFSCKVIMVVRSKEKGKKLFDFFAEKPYLRTYEMDFSGDDEIKKLSDVEEKIDYIIHGASPASPQLFVENPVGTIEPNVLGTYNLLKLAVEKKVKGFLFLSSGDVYGQIQKGNIIAEDSLGVVDQLNIRNSYAESKRMAEMICRAFYEQYHVPVKIARISHTYGPTISFENDRRVFSEFVQNIIHHENIVMKSTGEAIRPFCYLTDAVGALFKILIEGVDGEAYNMCNDECNYSIWELANILAGLFPERKLKVICEARAQDDTYRESPVTKPCRVDNTKLRSLGWKPQVGIKEGFKRMILAIESEGEKE